MSRMRVAVFVSGGPIALRALDALAAAHEVMVIVRARAVRPLHLAWRGAALGLARRLGVRPADEVAAWASAAGVPVLHARAGEARGTAERLRALAPDVSCIATWPRRVPAGLREAAGRACLNLHPSLLPRHRGASPLFWTYHAGDAAAGVTVHLATDTVDAGPILLQEPVPLGRGESVVAVHGRCAARGGELLARAVTMVGAGKADPRAQDAAAVTRAPSPEPGRSYAALDAWPSAQAWHFLAGLLARYRDPLRDVTGAPVGYTRVEGFEERAPALAPGAVVREGAGWAAWTRDGVVRLSAGGSER